MTNIGVAICGIIYLGTSIGFMMQKQWGFALAYLSYSIANIGLILAANGA